jgi:cob(I)alamin adenosyltransferase
MEIIITGRYASDELIALADLVTEMRSIKHYYDNGTEARKGIEY